MAAATLTVAAVTAARTPEPANHALRAQVQNIRSISGITIGEPSLPTKEGYLAPTLHDSNLAGGFALTGTGEAGGSW